MSGDDREDRLKELGEQLGWDFEDYSVYTSNELLRWRAAWERCVGEGETIARAEEDLISKLEKYIDEGSSEPAKDD